MGVVPTFFSYLLTCIPALSELETPDSVATGVGVTTAAVAGLEEGASYMCAVVASKDGYTSEPGVITVATEEIGKASSSADTSKMHVAYACNVGAKILEPYPKAPFK